MDNTLIQKLERIGQCKNGLPFRQRGWCNELGLFVQLVEATGGKTFASRQQISFACGFETPCKRTTRMASQEVSTRELGNTRRPHSSARRVVG